MRYNTSMVTFTVGQNGRFYAKTGSRWLTISSDGGVTWHESRLIRAGSETGRLAISSADPNILYVFGSHMWLTDERHDVGDAWRTLDGGQTWDLRSQKLAYGSPVVDSDDPSIVYLVGDGTTLRSTDGAASFEQIGIYEPDALPEAHGDRRNSGGLAAMSPDGSRLWFVAGKGGFYRSLDRGWTWQRLPDVPFSSSVRSVSASPHDPRVIFAVTLNDELWAYREPAPEPVTAP